tara:strand:+ start:129 stop:287 length:159 start_codon:yes stop_codon:yes gene_type:complete
MKTKEYQFRDRCGNIHIIQAKERIKAINKANETIAIKPFELIENIKIKSYGV